MSLLSEAAWHLLEALHREPTSWWTPEDAARELGWDVDSTADLLADLDVAGWVDVRERTDAIIVRPSPRAQRLLKSRIPARTSGAWNGSTTWSVPVAGVASR